MTGDNIYKVLIWFDKLYGMMEEEEKRKFMESRIKEIQICGERQSNGQWLIIRMHHLPAGNMIKQLKLLFKLPQLSIYSACLLFFV